MEQPTISKESAANAFRELEKIRPKAGQDYCVVAYFLSREPKDGCVGMWYFVGTYSSQKKASKMAEKIVREIGVPCAYSAPTCSWQAIDDKPDLKRTIMVASDRNEALEAARRETRAKVEAELTREQERMQQIELVQEAISIEDSPENYADTWLDAIRMRSSLAAKRKEIVDLERRLAEKKGKIQSMHANHPEYDESVARLMSAYLLAHGDEYGASLIGEVYEKVRSEIF